MSDLDEYIFHVTQEGLFTRCQTDVIVALVRLILFEEKAPGKLNWVLEPGRRTDLPKWTAVVMGETFSVFKAWWGAQNKWGFVGDGLFYHTEDAAKEAVEKAYRRGFENDDSFQKRVDHWLLECFGETIARDKRERNHRFLEEALELVQANDCSREEAHKLVDYVFDRPAGEIGQEIGGVKVTFAALCLAVDKDMDEEGQKELSRIWTKVEEIRAKQAAKPNFKPTNEVVENYGHTVGKAEGKES